MSRDCPHFPIGVPQMGIYAIVCTVDDRVYVSAAKAGRPPLAAIAANTGKPRSEEVKRKVGDANRGKKRTEEQLSRVRGRVLSTEHKQAMSTARKGVPWTQARWESHNLKQVVS